MRERLLGFGDYTHDGPNIFGRSLFLHAVSRCVPEAIQALVALPDDDAELRRWAAQWGFADEWAQRAAERHARHWREAPELIGHWIVTGAAWEPVFPPGPSWNPITETETAFRKRVSDYIETVKAAPAISKTPSKRVNPADTLSDGSVVHFEWLALHHVKGETYNQIAQRYQVESGWPELSGVSRAITDTAALIGLTLRPARGRLRKVEAASDPLAQ